MKKAEFLGYTSQMTTMQAARAEKQLEKLIRYNGKIYNYAEYITVILTEGFSPDKKDNVWYWKNDGTKSKPKTIYRLSNDKYCIEINKTQYDFAVYCTNNGYTTAEAIAAKKAAEAENIKTMEQARAEAEKRAEEAEKQAEEEQRQFEEWTRREMQDIPENQRNIIEAVFMQVYNHFAYGNYIVAVYVNHFDDPRCKAALISLLHNDNKASIKAFECLTGVRLPKAYRERKEVLNSLEKSDFKTQEIKPQKKPESANINIQSFYIVCGIGNKFDYIKVYGEPIEINNIKMFIHTNDRGTLTISSAECGAAFTTGASKEQLLSKLNGIFEQYGTEYIKNFIEQRTAENEKTIGKNPLYTETA